MHAGADTGSLGTIIIQTVQGFQQPLLSKPVQMSISPQLQLSLLYSSAGIGINRDHLTTRQIRHLPRALKQKAPQA